MYAHPRRWDKVGASAVSNVKRQTNEAQEDYEIFDIVAELEKGEGACCGV